MTKQQPLIFLIYNTICETGATCFNLRCFFNVVRFLSRSEVDGGDGHDDPYPVDYRGRPLKKQDIPDK